MSLVRVHLREVIHTYTRTTLTPTHSCRQVLTQHKQTI